MTSPSVMLSAAISLRACGEYSTVPSSSNATRSDLTLPGVSGSFIHRETMPLVYIMSTHTQARGWCGAVGGAVGGARVFWDGCGEVRKRGEVPRVFWGDLFLGGYAHNFPVS
jgi:hypothetical protein